MVTIFTYKHSRRLLHCQMLFGNSKKFRDFPGFFNTKNTIFTKFKFLESNISKKLFTEPVLCNLVKEL